jgi:hypothetical protein
LLADHLAWILVAAMVASMELKMAVTTDSCKVEKKEQKSGNQMAV